VDVVKLKDGGSIPIINTGSEVICLESGETLTNSGRLIYAPDTCHECGEEIDIDSDSTHSYNGYHYCESCFYEEYSYCTDCGEVVRNEDVINYDYNRYCEDCAERLGISRCYHCEEYDRELTVVGEEGVCDYCIDRYYTYCDECEEYVHDNDTCTVYIDGDSKTICHDCRNDNYCICDKCKDYHHEDNITAVGTDSDDNICDDCLERYYERCSDCDEFVTKTYSTDEDTEVCEECLEDKYFECVTCGRTYKLENGMYSDEDNKCKECKEDEEQQEAV
jgi:hypothetical protein